MVAQLESDAIYKHLKHTWAAQPKHRLTTLLSVLKK